MMVGERRGEKGSRTVPYGGTLRAPSTPASAAKSGLAAEANWGFRAKYAAPRQWRATTLALAVLLATSVAAQAPERASELVDLAGRIPGLHLDIRYATANNFLGRPVYPEARALLQRPAAEALARVQRRVLARGYGLLVFDAYRPWSVTKIFWDETAPEKRAFVADPAKGSRHNRGCAVDLTLYSRRTGREVAMPSPYDEFSERAAPGYRGGSHAERQMRDWLRFEMAREGFTVFPEEWWHFDYLDWQLYPVQDIPFSSIQAPTR